MMFRFKFWLYILAVAAIVRGLFFAQHLHEPLALDGNDTYLVESGQSLTRVLEDLGRRDILASPFDVRLYARLTGQADSIQAGEYTLTLGMTPLDLLDKIVRGDVTFHQIVLVEGWTAARALAEIQGNPYIETTIEAEGSDALRKALGLDVHPEGQFFPDTYNFMRGTTDRELLHRANGLMQEVLASEWTGREVGLPYENRYQALVMASIVEKETAVASEREKIAGVLVRRLRRDMRLQVDPTVIYGLGASYDGDITRADLQRDTPYNTYRRRGLPPTPIALPGRASIAASLHPDDSDALYFVARGDGTHHFSATLDDHNAAVRRYQMENTGQSGEDALQESE